ncbi:MAG TPA: glycosyltransferase family 4 protein [Polyangiaceae bacterium]
MASLTVPSRAGRKPRVLFLVASDWYFLCHRLSLGLAAQEAGYDVTVVTPDGPYVGAIQKAGLRHVSLQMVRQGRNPLEDLDTTRRLISLYRRERPDVVHHVAIKPMIYGTLAAKATRVPAIVNAMPGMGYVFLNEAPLARALAAMVKLAYKGLLSAPNTRTILQNPDDVEKWVGWGVMRRDRLVMIRGAGVDTQRFAPSPEPAGPCFVVLPARLLKDKGVNEFVEAARRLRKEGVPARFGLVGEPDLGNPASVTAAQMKAWVDEGIVESLGWRDDMDRVLRESHVTCLPSYGEGLPKALLEAAASGRPIVATDVPGCREVARNEENALLVPARDADALTRALRRVIEDRDLRLRLGARGRAIALAEFDQRHVAEATLAVYAELLARAPA